jgi:hypothetical protein
MSDSSEATPPVDTDETPPSNGQLPRIITAAPIGIVVIVLSIVMIIWTFIHFGTLAHQADTHDMRELFDALRLIVPALWIVVAMWGANQIVTGIDRATLADRLDGQDAVIHRIEQRVMTQETQKDEIEQKSRSFWARIRNDPN